MDSPDQAQERAIEEMKRLTEEIGRDCTNDERSYKEYLLERSYLDNGPWLLDAAQERDRLRRERDRLKAEFEDFAWHARRFNSRVRSTIGGAGGTGPAPKAIAAIAQHRDQLRAAAQADSERIRNLNADRLQVEQHNAELRDNATVDQERIRELEEALKWYGDGDNYNDVGAPQRVVNFGGEDCLENDEGRIAREALRGATGEK